MSEIHSETTHKQDKGISQILESEKRSWGSVAFIWIGTMICIPMLMVGGHLCRRLNHHVDFLGNRHRVCRLLSVDDLGWDHWQ